MVHLLEKNKADNLVASMEEHLVVLMDKRVVEMKAGH
jgi:hypothetical protein